jgi:L-iditol 2-dehydrogenase
VCGQYTDCGTVPLNPHYQINRKHVELRGTWGCDYSHFHRAVELVARFGDRVPWREMAGTAFPLEEANAALAAVERRDVLKALIVPNG